MELREFVSETLKQVIDGVKAAQDYATEKGASVNPNGRIDHPAQGLPVVIGWKGGYLGNAHIIEFDVAVTVAEGGQAKGGLGIFVGAVGVGTQAQVESKESKVSRIKFAVPLILPTQEVERKG